MNKKATTKQYLDKRDYKGFAKPKLSKVEKQQLRELKMEINKVGKKIVYLEKVFNVNDIEVNLDEMIPYTEDMLSRDKYLLEGVE